MCGIAGIVQFNNNEINLPENLLSLNNSIKHRGPDDEGYFFAGDEGETITAGGDDTPANIFSSSLGFTPKVWIENIENKYSLGLAHRRLSIIDPTPAGHQPMSYADDLLWIVFNGEIYNYIELRKELVAYGHHFITNTDTEVILAAYREWGKECLHRFNGMWAFVLYDKTKNLLFGSRDRFGVKPLYYHFKAGRLIFASEIKALMNSAFIKKKINNKAVFDFLSQGLSESEEEGFIIGIKELLAGHNFIFDLNRKEFSTTRYYSLNITEGYQPYDEALNRGYIDQIKDLTAKAVKLRLRSDIPIGATLSGGIDSSSIVSLMDLLAPGDRHKIFTAVFPKDPLDETSWAAKVVKDKRLSWHTWEAKPLDLLDNLESLVYTQDIPINGIATYTHFGLMKFIKTQNIHVILEGQGADELFTGYNSHIPAWLLETLKAGQFRKFIRDFNSFPSTVMDRSTLLRMLSKHTFGNGISSVNLLNILKNHKKDWALIDNNLWKSNVARLGKGRPILQGLNATLEKEFTGQRLKYLLKAGDRNSMAFSIESRLPFSDDINLIEHIFKIPGNYKIRNGYTKVLLREAMKGIIPEDIRLRTDKKGFSTPSSLFINKSVLNECAQYVTGDMDQFFDTKALKGMMSGDPRLHPIHSEKLWRFISLALWMKVYKLN